MPYQVEALQDVVRDGAVSVAAGLEEVRQQSHLLALQDCLNMGGGGSEGRSVGLGTVGRELDKLAPLACEPRRTLGG